MTGLGERMSAERLEGENGKADRGADYILRTWGAVVVRLDVIEVDGCGCGWTER
jgi:hypothetical protein